MSVGRQVNNMKILSIETSCDETSVAILECFGGFKNPRFNILSNVVLSQIDIHKEFGGVVPNLARREHQKNLVPILTQALNESGMLKNYKFQNLNKSKILTLRVITRRVKNSKKIQKILIREPELLEQVLKFLENYEKPPRRGGVDLISVTRGPGLEPALWVGVNFARALSCAWEIPLLGANHLEGHIYSVLLLQNRVISKSKFLISKQILNPQTEDKSQIQNKIPKIQFPAIALVVSGGHTEIVLMNKWLDYKIIGQTLDDAAGEAFDKAARILGLGYPGGPEISREAEKWKSQIINSKQIQNSNNQNQKIVLPRPMINSKDFNFSFSGLKTAVLYLTQNLKKSGKWSENLIPRIAYEFQEAAVDVLVKKSLKAVEKHNVKTFILCGGVSANKELRYRICDILYKKYAKGFNFLMPELEFSGDNAAMIGAAAYSNYSNLKSKNKLPKIAPFLNADGNLNF